MRKFKFGLPFCPVDSVTGDEVQDFMKKLDTSGAEHIVCRLTDLKLLGEHYRLFPKLASQKTPDSLFLIFRSASVEIIAPQHSQLHFERASLSAI